MTSDDSPASAVYRGWVRHRRYWPVAHDFRYPLFMMWLDLAEAEEVLRPYWLWSTKRPAVAWLRREDHLGPAHESLDFSVRSLVERHTGRRPRGPVRVLTHLRYFGLCFNPVSFFYIYSRPQRVGDVARVETIVAEIDNTPWGERHWYVLSQGDRGGDQDRGSHRYRLGKELHVSPFMPMDIDYDWRFGDPGRRLWVHMENWRDERLLFDATLMLKREEISSRALARALLRFPAITASTLARIYLQAGRLWLKRATFYPHPGSRPSSVTAALGSDRASPSASDNPAAESAVGCPGDGGSAAATAARSACGKGALP